MKYGRNYPLVLDLYIAYKKCHRPNTWTSTGKRTEYLSFVLFLSVISMLLSQVYNYCTNTNAQGAAGRTSQKIVPRTGANNRSSITEGANIVGGVLYLELKNYLKDYLEKICEVSFQKFQFLRNIPLTFCFELHDLLFLCWYWSYYEELFKLIRQRFFRAFYRNFRFID